MLTISEILIKPFILNLCIAFKAGFYESKIISPHWFAKMFH